MPITQKFQGPLQAIIRIAVQPVYSFKKLRTDRRKLIYSLLFITAISVLYTIMAIILSLRGYKPVLDPWINIPTENYYFYQIFWTLPWGISTWLLLASVTYLLASFSGHSKHGRFRDSLLITSASWVIPSFVLMWVPEMVLLLSGFRGRIPLPIELFRLMILPAIWQIYILSAGCRVFYRTRALAGILLGIINVFICTIMFLVFMR